MSNKLDLEEIADNLIDLGIENEWCMGDIVGSILDIINEKSFINDDGLIERK